MTTRVTEAEEPEVEFPLDGRSVATIAGVGASSDRNRQHRKEPRNIRTGDCDGNVDPSRPSTSSDVASLQTEEEVNPDGSFDDGVRRSAEVPSDTASGSVGEACISQPVTCKVCKKEFSDENALRLHRQMVQSMKVCKKCHKRLKYPSRVQTHMKSHRYDGCHFKVKVHQPDGTIKIMYECKMCRRRCPHIENIVKHLDAGHGPRIRKTRLSRPKQNAKFQMFR